MTENVPVEDAVTRETTTDNVTTEDRAATGRLMMRDEPDEALMAPCRPAAWVGFLELEEWARAVDPSRPVLLLPVVQPAAASYLRPEGNSIPEGRSAEDLVVFCQQVTAEGDVLYCRLRAATFTLEECPQGRAVLDSDWARQAMAWEGLWSCVEEDLAARGLSVLAATAAWPEGHRFLTGHASGIRYDVDQCCFRRPPFGADSASQDGADGNLCPEVTAVAA